MNEQEMADKTENERIARYDRVREVIRNGILCPYCPSIFESRRMYQVHLYGHQRGWF